MTLSQSPRLFAAALLLGVHAAAFAQNTFQYAYGSATGTAAGRGLAVLSNGNYIATGSSEADILVLCLAPDGSLLWSKTFDNDGQTDAADAVCRAGGDSFIFAYRSGSEAGIAKMSNDGAVLWNKGIFGPGAETIRQITRVSTGYVLTGNSNDGSGPQAIVLKIDENGNEQWSRLCGNGSVEDFSDVWEDESGRLYIAGSTLVAGVDGMLAQFSASGTLNWVRHYGGNGNEGTVHLAPTADGNLLLADHSWSFNNLGAYDMWLTKVDRNGNTLWSRTYRHPLSLYRLRGITATPGGGFAAVAGTPGDGTKGLLFQVNDAGDLLWARIFNNGVPADYLARIQLSPDGQILALGGSGDDVFLVKTHTAPDANECCTQAANLTVSNVNPVNEPTSLNVNQGPSLGETAFSEIQQTPATTDLCPTDIDLSFELSKDTICPGECVDITAVGNTPGAEYFFEVPGGEPDPTKPLRVCYAKAGVYTITRQGKYNDACIKKLSKTLVADPFNGGYFPNAFTPDNDTRNDQFKLIFKCPPAQYRLQIFGRWGELLFETTQPGEGWDGRVNGNPAPSDAYAWVATVDGKVRKGSVTLLR